MIKRSLGKLPIIGADCLYIGQWISTFLKNQHILTFNFSQNCHGTPSLNDVKHPVALQI